MCVTCLFCPIVVLLPPGENPFAVKNKYKPKTNKIKYKNTNQKKKKKHTHTTPKTQLIKDVKTNKIIIKLLIIK
jgi:hypothetical protein